MSYKPSLTYFLKYILFEKHEIFELIFMQGLLYALAERIVFCNSSRTKECIGKVPKVF